MKKTVGFVCFGEVDTPIEKGVKCALASLVRFVSVACGNYVEALRDLCHMMNIEMIY